MRASRKHSIVVSIKDASEARPLIRMAEAVAGGAAELKARPTFSVILCTVSPLHMERFGMELALELGDAGIPMMLYPMPILGATSPVTPAGTAVVGAAEILAAVTAIQLSSPGAKLVHAGGPTALFMRTGSYFANVPEALLLRAVQGQMARHWGLPAGLGWGGTKAKRPDSQAAYENTLGLVLEMMAGADFCFGAGLLDSVSQMSLEELVIADEVFGMVTRLLRGVTVDRETLAVDLIKKMGFSGNYLFDSHTRAHVHELWRAKLGETGTFESWKSAGSPRLEDKARAVADGILASPAPEFPAEPRASSTTSSPRSSPAASEKEPPMAYADKCYVGKRVKLDLLSRDDVRQIHEATLDVIENCGVKFHSQNALDVLEANGVTVDRESTWRRSRPTWSSAR